MITFYILTSLIARYLAQSINTGEIQTHFSRRVIIDDVTASVFRQFVDVTINACIQECKFTKGCSLVNYEYVTHVCSLVHSTGGERMVMSSKIVTVNLSTVKTVSDPCQHCADFQNCNSNNCVTQGCPPPNDSHGHLRSGNIMTVNSSLAYRCNDTQFSDSVSYSTCLSDGSWTNYNLYCGPNIPYPLETGTLSDGTKVTFFIVNDQVTFQGAADYCTSVLTRLLQITTSQKLTFFQSVMSRQENNELGYWVDVVRDRSSGPWSTSTGVSLPGMTNSEFWGESSSSARCARASRSSAFRWRGIDCQNVYGFLCEM